MRQVLGRLREWGLGERVIKTALAAALAWEVAVVVTRNPRPYLAPLVAILTLQITIAQSVSRAVQRILGVILGVVMALLVTHVIGVHVWSIALLVAVAFTVGTRLRLGPYAPPEAAVTALLVMLIGSTTRIEYALVRMVDTLIGAVVGVAVNAAIVPPSYLPDVRRAAQGLAESAAGALRELGDAVAAGLSAERAGAVLARARDLQATIEEVDAALARAEESLRYNVLAAREARRLEAARQSAGRLTRAALQARTIARTLRDAVEGDPAGPPPWLQPGALGAALAQLLLAAADVVQHAEPDSEANGGAAAARREAWLRARARRDDLAALARERLPLLAEGGWVPLGSTLAEVDKLLADLAPRDLARGEELPETAIGMDLIARRGAPSSADGRAGAPSRR